VEEEEVLRKLNLKAKIPTMLIMGGGQGLGPIKTIVKSLEKVKGELQEIIVTGINQKLYSSLKKRVKKYKKKILVLSYVNDINELMSISNLLITKPGGVTTAEALTKKIPMIIVKPIPGQEANNASYLTEKKAAIRIDDPRQIYLIVEDLLKNTAKLDRMREAAQRISKPNASLDIARLLLNEIQDKHSSNSL
jgi:processive 1,2-diacylglycerol beta-glucosyltransferase